MTSTRLLPDTGHPDFAPFWRGCAEGQLLMPRCEKGHLIWPPRPACPKCAALADAWVSVQGTGRLYSWTVVHRTRLRWFSERTPYVVGIVTLDLDEPVRMVARCDIDPQDAAEGVHLVVDFEDLGGHVTMPYFRRAAETSETGDG